MRTTLNIEDNLIKKVSKLTGIKEKTTLVKLGLEALIAMESGKRLARLGGTEKDLKNKLQRRFQATMTGPVTKVCEGAMSSEMFGKTLQHL